MRGLLIWDVPNFHVQTPKGFCRGRVGLRNTSFDEPPSYVHMNAL